MTNQAFEIRMKWIAICTHESACMSPNFFPFFDLEKKRERNDGK